ncbi:MAG TPA: DUF2267 domain-containing protein, partial [Acidimicrobiales bacterium]|nr:DUF2267 domain-containing protein [Acidimicrobiales bacterium]
VATGVAAGVTLLLRSPAIRHRTRRGLERATRWARYESGRLEGLRYHLAGRHPDPDVYPTVLADRIRSALGPLEHRLDIPRVHVMVEGHTVLLHGEVDDERQAWAIEDAVRRVPGVERLQSHLAVGLTAGDSRPSQGASEHASTALVRVLDAARAGGATRGSERGAARAALSTFAAQLPAEERRHLLSHLPADLRALAALPRPVTTAGAHHLRHADDLVTATGIDPTDPDRARAVVTAVLGALRELVPEEARGVAAVLPADLRALWEGAGVLR